MATFMGSASSSSSWIPLKNSGKNKGKNNGRYNGNNFRVSCVSSAGTDPYKTLRIRHGASESEVKKAFRQLALQVLLLSRFPFCDKNVFFTIISLLNISF